VSFTAARRSFHSDDHFLEEFVVQALLPKLLSSRDIIPALRENIAFAGQTFCLWAPAPRAGDPDGSQQAFDANILRVVDELPFKRSFSKSLPVFRKPDLTFFVNGLFFSYAELKNGFTGQSAAGSGRKKIAHNMVEASERALRHAIAEYEASGGSWPGWKGRNLSESVRNAVRSSICLYEKSVHIIAADASKMFVLSGSDWILEEVDAALNASNENLLLTEKIPAKIVDAFAELPEIYGLSHSEAIFEHLASFFHPALGVDKDVFFFNQVRKSRTTTVTEILRPRAAQRAMLYRTRRRVSELYKKENESKVSEGNIRAKLALELPDLPADVVDDIVHKSLLHLNGKESHSILLQGSTGLGKTNLIVWIAQDLADMKDPASDSALPLFDVAICLTDRTELRKNLGDEAARLKSTRGAAIEATTFDELKSALVAGTKIIMVNIQKFPGLMAEAERDKAFAGVLSSKRVAFIIDEAHRSQNGEYHETTMELFSEFKNFEGGAKRNLVVCLTATPTDATLARFGEWRAPKFAGDEIRWTPFFSYPLARAVKDRVVLNPLMNVQRYGDHIQVKAVETVESVAPGESVRDPSSEEIYENDNRRKLVAANVAKLFAVKTIMAVRSPSNEALGRGKAMFVANSVRGAIAYQKHIKAALIALSKDPKFSDRSEVLANCPVLVLYSDKQGERSCAELNDGKNEEQILKEYRRVGEHAKKDGLKIQNAIIVVVDKLLTGFDEPTLHTIFIDRGMDGVLLYQSASRVNRTEKWKNDCMIVDFSHDGCVSRNLPKVFAKYGGMTVSEFDALPVKERMDEAYKVFFGSKEVAGLWKSWVAESKSDKEAAALNLNDALEKLLHSNPEQASFIRKTGGIWRAAKDNLTGILDFALPELIRHAEPQRRAFVNLVVTKLRVAEMDKAKMKGMVFDVDMVDQSEGWSVEDLSPEIEDDENTKKKKGGVPKEKKGAADAIALDIIGAIEDFQAREDAKLDLMNRLRAFIDELFLLIDMANQADNNGYHKKRVVKMLSALEDYPWDDRQKKFKELLNGAVLQPKFPKSQFFRDNKKTFWEAVLRKSDLLMADYEEWTSEAQINAANGSPSLGVSTAKAVTAHDPQNGSLASNGKVSVQSVSGIALSTDVINNFIEEHRDENGDKV
jgi:type I restriction enzyme R subunit